jgi:hypothetical protein
MTENTGAQDEGRGVLALIGVREPSRAHDARVRARCHAALERRRRREAAPARPGWRGTFEPALVGTLCAVYLFEVLSRAILLYRF